MKKFLIKSIYFSITLLVLFVFVEYKLSKVTNSYNYKRANLEQQLDSIQVLVLGSSQATYGINPSYFKQYGYNASNVSQTVYYDTRIALKYIDKMPKLNYVLLNLTYFSFGYQIADGAESWRDYFYDQYWDIPYHSLKKYDPKRYSKTLLYAPLTLDYFQHGFQLDLIPNYQPNGYIKYDSIQNNKNISDSLGKLRVRIHDINWNEDRYAENKRDLEHLVAELKKRSITAILVTPPVLETYYKYANKEKLEKNKKLINSLCTKYNCAYFDYFTDKRFVKRDFYDNDHLNFVGAEKFSKIIDSEIIK